MRLGSAAPRSPACDHCYAEHWTVTRFGKAGWGPRAERVRSAESTWKRPHAWNRKALRTGTRPFVFCSELSDVFDNQTPDSWRADLWALICETPALVWLILTKRPQNTMRMLPPDWGGGYPNVWLGVTAEDQREVDRRLPVLCDVPAKKRFVSAEPLLGEVDLGPWLNRASCLGRVSWVIAGSESLGKREGRQTEIEWARYLRDQCAAAGAAFWLKQLAVSGRIVELPELDGRVWAQRPGAAL